MTPLKPYHLHPILFAIFPVLALLAHNVEEVAMEVVLRPLLFSIVGAVLIFVIARILLKCWGKAALATSFFLVLFFSYGHVYNAIRSIPDYGLVLGRHRYLIIVYGVVLFAGLWRLLRTSRYLQSTNHWFSLIGVLLILYPLVQIADHARNVSIAMEGDNYFYELAQPLVIESDDKIPDVYYIILDMYTRADSMLETFNYDNTPFLSSLRSLGFFVAECSRCNHCSTRESLTSSLNMNYMETLSSLLEAHGLEENIWVLLKNSVVRESLEQIGYQTIAFDSGFEWSRLRDADLYLAFDRTPFQFQMINPFELLLIKSTAGLLWTDLEYKSILREKRKLFEPIKSVNFPYEEFARRELFILDQLPRLASIPGRKFVFVHVLIPHHPRIFSPEGDILDDVGYYAGPGGEPIDGAYEIKGYTNEVKFINSQILSIVETILQQSDRPPIIVIQGDTGGPGSTVYNILNAYYLMGESNPLLYDAITPVNTFRLIFDSYFGSDYGLLPDRTYADGPEPIPETSATCIR